MSILAFALRALCPEIRLMREAKAFYAAGAAERRAHTEYLLEAHERAKRQLEEARTLELVSVAMARLEKSA